MELVRNITELCQRVKDDKCLYIDLVFKKELSRYNFNLGLNMSVTCLLFMRH